MTYSRGTILVDNVTKERVKIIDWLIQRDNRELYVIQTESGQIRRQYLPTVERNYSPDNVIQVCFYKKTILNRKAS